MSRIVRSAYTIHDMSLFYLTEEDTGIVGLQLVPKCKVPDVVQEKAYSPEPLIQIKLVGDDYPFGFSQGRTMRNAQSTGKMKYIGQECQKLSDDTSRIVTALQDKRGYDYEHTVTYDRRSDALEFSSSITNNSGEPITIEMMSSFTLGGMTPFIDGIADDTLVLHRMRSTWSAEGRLVSDPVEELQLEPSWSGCSANSIRFGQVGSMPVRGYFPFAAVEDTKTGVTWAVQLTHGSSWQMEAYRKDDALVLSGGIADREFGHWSKTLQPGEQFITPKAVVTVVSGGVNEAAARLTENMRKALQLPDSEKAMPVIFNEYCTTWGKPEENLIARIAEQLKGRGITYFVLDAGWFAGEEQGWENIGEWKISQRLFPSGMEKTVERIRKCGMRPGIWFEFEVSARDCVTFHAADRLLTRDGIPITSGNRRFWDMRRGDVQDYLAEKVIGLLKQYGFEYLKVDYNETIGIGCEGAESLGEGLRAQILATQDFFRRIHTEIPQLVIENCSSGGHRLVPSFLELTSMSSFSDAHECDEIPIIAANMHRAILPRQSQIWAVFRAKNPLKKFYYQISSTMLGRFCLSGDVAGLSDAQWSVVQKGIDFYRDVSHIIDYGTTSFYGSRILSYRNPKGWQGVVRQSKNSAEILVVFHTFHAFADDIEIAFAENITINRVFAREGISAIHDGNRLRIKGASDFDGITILLNADG